MQRPWPTACSAGSWPARSRPTSSPRPRRPFAFRDLNPQAPLHVLVVPRTHVANAAELADGEPETVAELVRVGAAGRGRRGPRRLPAGVQHRRGGRADGLPRPPARAGRTGAVVASRMSRARRRGRRGRRRALARWPSRPVATAPPRPATDAKPTARRLGRRAPQRPRQSRSTASVAAVKPRPLRAGESADDAAHAARPTRPSAPNGVGTDDYRCFLLDPHLAQRRYLTGTYVQPDNRNVVHHVILFRADPDQVGGRRGSSTPTTPARAGPASATAACPTATTSTTPRGSAPGHPGPGVRGPARVRRTAGARAPGSSCRSTTTCSAAPAPTGRPPCCGWPRPRAHLTPLQTMLLPAPVELPCRPGHADNPLCDRDAVDRRRDPPVRRRSATPTTWLNLLCGEQPASRRRSPPAPAPSPQPTTIRAVAGHMHLLGPLDQDPGRSRHAASAKTILDIPVWDFDNQGARPIKPVHPPPGETVKVTCKHVQWLRDRLPGVPRAARPVRRVGRGHHRRDVPGHPDRHASVSPRAAKRWVHRGARP